MRFFVHIPLKRVNGCVQILGGKFKQHWVIFKMPQPTIAMITQHAAHLPCVVAMVNHKRTRVTTNNTLRYRRFDIFQGFVRNNGPVPPTADAAPVSSAALPAPTIKPVALLVVQGKRFGGSGFCGFAPRAGQQFHTLSALFILLFGSFAVFALVFFFLCPSILAQNESLRLPPSGWGRFSPGFPGLAAL